jgi:hypothetical protein
MIAGRQRETIKEDREREKSKNREKRTYLSTSTVPSSTLDANVLSGALPGPSLPTIGREGSLGHHSPWSFGIRFFRKEEEKWGKEIRRRRRQERETKGGEREAKEEKKSLPKKNHSPGPTRPRARTPCRAPGR